MLSVTYVSAAVHRQKPEILVDILRQSRTNNAAVGITGLLLHVDGNFIQALEGPDGAVLALLRRIEADARHSGMMILIRETLTERRFPNWAMGFHPTEDIPGEDRAALSSFLRETGGGSARVSPAAHLLDSFRRTMIRCGGI
jgi:hypothetical protein